MSRQAQAALYRIETARQNPIILYLNLNGI